MARHSKPDISDLGKHLSYVLRHRPEDIGLSLMPGGWLAIDDVISGLGWDRGTFDRVVALSARYEISGDGRLVRAHHGHSVKGVDLDYAPQTPPDTLWHGTADRFLDAIMSEGLRPMSRRYVHLAGTPDEAKAVGSRHGRPVVLAVDAKAMHDEGRPFFPSGDGVWLVDRVEPRFLSVAE